MNHRYYYVLAFTFLWIFCSATGLQAQYRVDAQSRIDMAPVQLPPSVLYPEPTYWWLGLVVGANVNQHSGDFVTVSCDRIFQDAEGEGIYLGLQLEHRLSDVLVGGLRVAYNDYAARGSYIERDVPTLVDIINGEDVFENMDHTYASDIKLSYVSVNPFIEFFPIGGLYLFAGPAVGFLMNGAYNCTDEVPEEFEFVRNEETLALEDDIDIPNAESIRLDLRGGIGYNLQLSRAITIAPEVGYNLGLTTISDDDDWTAHAFTAVIVFKLAL